MSFVHVVGARPNFMKADPVIRALSKRRRPQILVHTGQHYDEKMSAIFFGELGLPEPDHNLEVGSGSHARQTAGVMMRLEELFLRQPPDHVLVYGDVNSTMAAALVCAKLHISFSHVEAGLRSKDRAMPEEINRVVTDQLADNLFTPSHDGDENLMAEGVDSSRIHRVGNVMIDTLLRLQPKAEERWPLLQESLGIRSGTYILVTLHRPSNVDDPEYLARLISCLESVSRAVDVVFPIHPRTRKQMADAGIHPGSGACRIVAPVGYLDFVCLMSKSLCAVTDSGGVQEETTQLGIPCLTMRENTERPITVEVGTNTLVGRDLRRLEHELEKILSGNGKRGSVPPLWDGNAGERIAAVLG
jgi:UDP-N-acetylglucosamine 2-epimerase (non-hydrolysing)